MRWKRTVNLAFGGRDATRASPLRRPLAALARRAFPLLLLAAACDDTFVPIERSDLSLSVFGFLDAAADTQWLRVTPIRDVIVTDSSRLDARVTLRDQSTGRVLEMRDSVMAFRGPQDDLGSQGVFVHNFWTTEPILPGSTYLFSATIADLPPAEGVIEIPPAYDIEVWIRTNSTERTLRLEGLEHVAFAGFRVSLSDECGEETGYRFFPLRGQEGDTWMIPMRNPAIGRQGCGAPDISSQTVRVIGSGGAWPSGVNFGESLDIPDLALGISGAVGFVGGVLTREIPHENCRILGRDPPAYCQLRYDDATATLRGTVRESNCAGGPIRAALVALTELDPALPGNPRLRTTETNAAGEFLVSALDGGQRYQVEISRVSPDPDESWTSYADTLALSAGSTDTLAVALRRFTCAA